MHTEESKASIRAYQLGRPKKRESILKTITAKTKRWADLSYMGKHRRIWKKFGKAVRCDAKACDGSCQYFEWANVSGEYREEPDDWKMMCCRCHKLMDLHRRK